MAYAVARKGVRSIEAVEVTEANRIAEVEIALYCCRHAVEEKSASEGEERKRGIKVKGEGIRENDMTPLGVNKFTTRNHSFQQKAWTHDGHENPAYFIIII